MSVTLYGELNLPENAGERKLDRIIFYMLGEDGAIRLEGVRAINFAENNYRGYISASGNHASSMAQAVKNNRGQ
jgi:hypothetical protein